MKRKVKKLTGRNQGKSWGELCLNLRRAVVGWVNYYALADGRNHMIRFDAWLRRRMRQMIWKQWKRAKNRYQRLRQRGVSEYWAVRAGGSSKGYWRMSSSPPIHLALGNDYLERSGLVSFSQQYDLRRT